MFSDNFQQDFRESEEISDNQKRFHKIIESQLKLLATIQFPEKRFQKDITRFQDEFSSINDDFCFDCQRNGSQFRLL